MTRVPIYSLAALILISSGLDAAEKKATPKSAPAPATTVRGIEPLSLSGDLILITNVAPQTTPIGGTLALNTGSGRATLVFRVQILTSQGFGEARKAAQVAEEIFDQPVHVDYEIPNFKVRVGDFADRGSAEEYRRVAQQLGYSNCWVVPVTIGIIEASPLYDSLRAPLDSVNKSDSTDSQGGGK